jgi:hypothetical protein
MNTLPTQLAELLHYCNSLAKMLLEEQHEFYPFGTYLSNAKVITQRMFHDGDDFPLSSGLINIIRHDFDQQLATSMILASAITYAARITNSAYPEPVDVIIVRLNDRQMASPVLHYLPYQLIEGKVEYGSTWIAAE